MEDLSLPILIITVILIYRWFGNISKKKDLTEVYSDYLNTENDMVERQNILELLWNTNQQYKDETIEMLDTAIAEQDAIKLGFCMAVVYRDGMDQDYLDRYLNIILDTWHYEHEDMVQTIVYNPDERFCDAILKIATDNETYRSFDGVYETALRKCVYALIAINTRKSQDMLKELIANKNPNVESVLEEYN